MESTQKSSFIMHKGVVLIQPDLNNREMWYVAKHIDINNADKDIYKKLICEAKIHNFEEYYECKYDLQK